MKNNIIQSQPLLPLPENGEILIPSSLLPSYIGVAPQTLARWRHEGNNLKFIKVGRRVVYKTQDIRDWLDDQNLRQTA